MWALAAVLFFLQAADPAAEGMKALEAGNYDAAVQAFRKALEADPKDYAAHFNLALAYGFLHQDEEGIAEYQKTLELKPGLYEAELNLAILLLRRKRPAEAAPLLESAAGQKPAEFRPRYYLAEAQLAGGAADKAGESFRLALELDPKSAAAELGLAHALEQQGKTAEAAPHFRQAAQLDPKYRTSLLELAQLYEKDHQPSEAMAIYREFPEDVAATEHLGQLLLDAKQYAEAVTPLEQAYQRDPTEAGLVALAMAYLFSQQGDKAVPLLDKAVAADPANFELHMMYARALRDRKQLPEAARQFREAVKVKPGDAAAWSNLASVLYLTGDYEQSLAAFVRAQQLGEDTPGNWFLRAIILDKLRQLKPALEAYQRFLSMSQGKNPDQEFQARQRVRIIQRELERH